MMNERIQKLAEQAGLGLELQSLRVEKFAELIVRESIAEMQDAFDMTIEEANHLLDYFGVEVE